MLEVKFIRENKELVIKRLAKRNMDATQMIEDIVDVDAKRRKAQTQLDNHLAQANQVSKKKALYYKTGEIEGND